MASSYIQSLANNYEITLLETNKTCNKPSSEQILKCFQTWDKIIPLLGQYRRVMKLIRDDIYEAVFSREYTVGLAESQSELMYNRERRTNSKTVSVDRVPHFHVLDKIMGERNKRADDAEKENERVRVVLGQLEQKIKELAEQNNNLEEAIDIKNEEIQDLNLNLANSEVENTRLVLKLKEQQENLTSKINDLQEDSERLNGKLLEEFRKVEYLTSYKKCHDDLQDHFRDLPGLAKNPPSGLFSAKEQKLRKDINEGRTIEKQLLELRNTCIDEFDQFVEKQVLEEKRLLNPLRNQDDVHNDQSFEILETEERRKYEDTFVKMIENIENELEQNKQHLAILKTELDKLNKNKRESQPKDAMKPKWERSKGVHNHNEENESRLLEIVKDSNVNYQFLPQEPNLNKYAIIAMYSCNQGKSFYEFQHVQHCKSCGQKTLVCPHKVTKGENVFHLPPQATHIRFTRPELSFSSDITKQEICEEKAPMSPVSFELERHPDNYARFWNDLKSRGQSSVAWVPRVIEENLLVSLIKQFYDWILWADLSDNDETLMSMLDSWYVFLNDRYQVQNVTVLAAKDLSEAISSTVQTNRFVQLFAECVCGNLDPAVFRHYLMLSQLVKSVKWKSKGDFTCFAKIAYPFMNVDDLEQFTMSYISFSENKISATLVCRFFLYIILKQREPGFLDMESQLLQYSTNVGHMTDVVFFESLAEISPLSSEPLSQRLFAQSKADTQTNYVSISRLSQIAAFLHLQQRTAVIEIQINEKLQNED